jgi:hypothetical protein
MPQPDDSTAMDEIRAWFALGIIKQPLTEAVE